MARTSRAIGLDAPAFAEVQPRVRRRRLRTFLRRGLLAGDDDAPAMAPWQHVGGFSVRARGPAVTALAPVAAYVRASPPAPTIPNPTPNRHRPVPRPRRLGAPLRGACGRTGRPTDSCLRHRQADVVFRQRR